MIHFDTNYVIGSVAALSPVEISLLAWIKAGEKFSVSAVAWSEFLNGPVTPRQEHMARAIVEGRIVAFGAPEADVAARLFNQVGRK